MCHGKNIGERFKKYRVQTTPLARKMYKKINKFRMTYLFQDKKKYEKEVLTEKKLESIEALIKTIRRTSLRR